MSMGKIALEEIDKPIETGWFDLLKKGKLRCVIIYEDGSFIEYFKKFDKTYTITIKRKEYLLSPQCILKGKNNTIFWYFNNPLPINLKHQTTTLSTESLMEKEKLKKMSTEQKQIRANVLLDAESINAVFNSRLLKGLYEENNPLTGKTLLVVFVIIAIVTLIILHFTGVIDIGSFLGVR